MKPIDDREGMPYAGRRRSITFSFKTVSQVREGVYQTAYCRPTADSNVAFAACSETAQV